MTDTFEQVSGAGSRSAFHFVRMVALGCFLGWSLTGCANLRREAQRSDGLLDFVQALVGHPRVDVVPIERVSGRAGEIVTAHAEADRKGGTYVSGTLHNGFGYSEIYDAHIDVNVLGTNRQLVSTLSTDYFPRPIPITYHGMTGRAWFSVRLPFVPPAGSTVQVVFHQDASGLCKPTQNRLGEKPAVK